MNLLFLFCAITVLASPNIEFPIRFAYVNRIQSWWPIKDVAKGMGVPGYASKTIYNMFALTVWTYERGPLDLAKLWNDPVTYLSETSDFGRSNSEIRKNIKQKYTKNSIKLLVSAFAQSEYPTTKNIDPELCATKLAIFVKDTGLDGVDINYQDQKAFQDGIGEIWVIKFTKKLRSLLPDHIISHAPQATSFHETKYRNGGYMKIHKEVGHLIDFYNVQFYNQRNQSYTTYSTLFLDSIPNSYILGTSVKQLNSRGIPLSKIVVGKPASSQNVMNTGLVSGQQLGQFIMKAYKQLGWSTGVMVWEYFSDTQGSFIQASAGQLVQKFLFDQLSVIFQSKTTVNPQNSSQSKNKFSQIQFLTTPTVNKNTNQIKKIEPYQARNINYPIRFTTVDRIASWWPPQSIAASFGVPGYANDSYYNYFSLSTWTFSKGALSMAKVWENPIKYFTNSSVFGATDSAIRKKIVQNFHKENIGLLISAFGSSQNPATNKIEPIKCAAQLADYVISNQLDGVQIKFFDTLSLQNKIGQFWLIKFTSELRKKLPNHLIVHTCFPLYFDSNLYSYGGYSLVNKAIGNLIDFYIVYYFDQGKITHFENYQQIFMLSEPPKFGTSVRQLLFRGVPMHKIVIGKPVSKQNSLNTGWIDASDLSKIVMRAYKEMRWFAGVMLWEYFSDSNQKMIKTVTQQLIITCATNANNCKPV